ncbi:unnamed protein product [Ceratitis capitata]|uniref:(Mediterranean fruit fly) hypothetical protein n=1 Tax=Ceratitis capitata TaxID=7213 RepID=A0A811VFX3_CERCA|nr:unnamed protein product [Ceratitis capitata]
MVAKQQVVAYTQKSQIKHENRHIQLVREYGFHPRTKATVEDGDVLPKKFEPFPENMYGKPLEEIDNFIYEEKALLLLFNDIVGVPLSEDDGITHYKSMEGRHNI